MIGWKFGELKEGEHFTIKYGKRTLEGRSITEGKEEFIRNVLIDLQSCKKFHPRSALSSSGYRACKILAARGLVHIYTVCGEERIMAKGL